jgi:alkanesulfonate monooxygenase SsuD/methylene tetrahydromethanopterin reductase-like flavin-dependent oxidoreductase (luciferase family)
VQIGLTMPTHGLLARDERDATLQRVDASEMRPVEVARLAEALGYHSVWFSDHVVMERVTENAHPSKSPGSASTPTGR